MAYTNINLVYTKINLGIHPNETFDPLGVPQYDIYGQCYNSEEKKSELWYRPKLIWVYTLIQNSNYGVYPN